MKFKGSIKPWMCLLVLVVTLSVAVVGCGQQEEEVEKKEIEDPGEVAQEEAAPEGAAGSTLFAEYTDRATEVEPSVDPYRIDPELENVINRDMFHFSEEAKEQLVEKGFVVVSAQQKEFYSLYEKNFYLKRPSFITTDSMLHNYHLFFNRLLEVTEKNDLLPALKELTESMLAVSGEQYRRLQDTEWEGAALRNAGYFAVAAELLNLDVDKAVPQEVESLVEQELELIEAREGMNASPLMNMGDLSEPPEEYLEDYTQYTPRGHYAGESDLESYFQAMMWYGRMTFRTLSEDETRSALLQTLALGEEDTAEKWEDMYAVTGFFVGQSDDITCREYAGLIDEIYGEEVTLESLAEEGEKFREFFSRARDLDPPDVQSLPIYDEDLNPDRDEVTRGYRFMGQRFTLDAFIFQRLIYREVGENEDGARRMLPKGLDVPAAMGSEEAYRILEEKGETEYRDYRENMEELQDYVEEIERDTWTGNLYWGWLYTLEALTEKRGEGYPVFMQNRAWEKKELNTFLGSYTELKHDTVLYSKQVYAQMGGVMEEDDRGYVEPAPEVYGRLASLAEMTREGLDERRLISERDRDNLEKLEQLSVYLKEISEKQLTGEELTEEEHDLIRSYGGQLEHFWLEAMREEDDLDAAGTMEDSPAAVITDVATNPQGREVLQVGTGDIYHIYAVVPVEDTLRIAKGGVYSHYEFPQPMQERLTNEEWHEMLRQDEVPLMCPWKKEFIVDE